MLCPRSRRSQNGLAFVELMLAVSIVGVALMVMLQQLTISYRENGDSQQRSFAYEKAMAILAELQAGVERGDIADAEALEELDDEGVHNVVLTTLLDEDQQPLAPTHPLSGNVMHGADWAWSRTLEITIPPEQGSMRYAKVDVFHRDHGGHWRVKSTVTSLLSLAPRAFPPVTAYDVYVLALAAAPSLWQPMVTLRASLENAVDDLETIDNGLDFRLHWITEFGYGRDLEYVPYVNTAAAASVAGQYVYWYPGLLGAGGPTHLFTPEFFSGRIRTDAGIVNDYDAVSMPHPHAVADQWNHCMRLPEARALFEQRVAAGVANADEPPLQILLADIAQQPDRFRNAMFLNLHGEGLPVPPLRNFADAAKEPIGHAGVRVVTHPVRLRTARDPDLDNDHADTQDLDLLVYAYKTDAAAGATVLDVPITVQIMGVDLTAAINGPSPTLTVRRLPGGIDTMTGAASGAGRDYYSFDTGAGLPPTAPGQPFEMYYEAGYATAPQPHTWIRLHKTPLVAPQVGMRGLAASERLYGMEYIPSPVSDTTTPADLAVTGGSGTPKNTARWRLRIPKNVFVLGAGGGGLPNVDIMFTVTTRIGTDVTTGVLWPTPNQPTNISTTHAWWAASPAAVPLTERYQFLGDPRHNPYVDLCRSGESFANGYNWNFDNLRDGVVDASASWPCFDVARLQDGFGNGVIADVPRFAQLWREVMQACGGVFTNTAGATAGSLLLGAELALPPAAPLDVPATVTLDAACFGGTGTLDVDSVTPDVPLVAPGFRGRHVVAGFGVSGFWAKEWLGELVPDSDYVAWAATGNLQAGATPGRFHRELRSSAALAGLPPGTSFAYPSGSALSMAGGVTLMNTGSTSSTFMHQPATPTTVGAIQDPALAISAAIGLPQSSEFPAAQPFGLSLVFPGALPHFAYTDSFPRSFASLLETHYDAAPGLVSSGPVALESPSSAASAFFDTLGLTPIDAAQQSALVATSVLMTLQTYYRAGEASVTARIVQVPRTEILAPAEGTAVTNPGSLSLRWQVAFERFDGQPYTPAYPAGFSEPEVDLRYVWMYSRDDGQTWRYAANDAIGDAEQRPADPSLYLLDVGAGAESFLLFTPVATFPAADYLFRVTTYHSQRGPHTSRHQVRVRITR